MIPAGTGTFLKSGRNSGTSLVLCYEGLIYYEVFHEKLKTETFQAIYN